MKFILFGIIVMIMIWFVILVVYWLSNFRLFSEGEIKALWTGNFSEPYPGTREASRRLKRIGLLKHRFWKRKEIVS
jgi:hypothetical protein